MSKSKSRNVGIGLGVLVGSVIGIGVLRSRKRSGSSTQSKVLVEDSVYRGFRYVIEQCSTGPFLASIPAQAVGEVKFDATQSKALDRELARKWVQTTIDAKLGPELQAAFLGARRR